MFDLTGDEVSLLSLRNIILNDSKISVGVEALEKVRSSYSFLEKFAQDKLIYGINTGLGPMTQYRINNSDLNSLQYNLIRSHSAGCGNPIDSICVKAAMIARLSSLSKGFSGIHIEALELLTELINKNIIPFIPEHGGVGASGDLVQLAHLALVMIGEGEVFYEGERKSTSEVFKTFGLKPIKMHIREGLSLINGTSVMTGIGIVNLIYAKNILNWMIIASSMLGEIVASYDDYFSDELNRVKHHKGQRDVASAISSILKGSALIKKRSEHLYEKKIVDEILEEKVQEYYSIRCVPQILGPVLDTIRYAESIVLGEFESVSDNPIVDVENSNVFHGGNFHGDYVSLEMDKLKIAIAKLSLLSERHINYLMNSNLNKKIPPFANLGTLGLNLGMQGVQFTAVSTAAENQTLSYPMYLHTIPNNNDNQDIVSMGTNSALIAKKVIDNSYEVLSIEFIALIQSIEYLKNKDKLSPFNKMIYSELRKVVPVFIEDTPKYKSIEAMKSYLLSVFPEAGEMFI